MRSVQHLMRLAREGWDHRNWYRDMEDVLLPAASALDTNVTTLTQVLALTSPRAAVTRSVRVTVQYLGDGTLPKDVTRSTRAALQHWLDTGKIRGPKTSAFARALQGDEDAVVLDTWMATALGVDQRKFSTKRVHSSASRRVKYGAYLMGITPAQFQAAVWSGTVTRAGRKVPSIAHILRGEIHEYRSRSQHQQLTSYHDS